MRIPKSTWLILGAVVALAAPVLLAFDDSLGQDRLWAEFRHPVKFADRLLPVGNYLIVHDDQKSAMAEPCLYVYGESDLDEPLLAIHCLRRAQAVTERDRIVWGSVRRNDVREFGYVQFAGDAYAHYVQ
jgi:hypothetical protein